MAFIRKLNDRVADSAVGRWFRLDGSGHKNTRVGSRFTTEIRAGITTWSTMVYIISVNAIILSQSGGTCICESTAADPICIKNPAYNLCKDEIRRDLITSTAAISALASFLMGLLANLPVGLAPGMGLNAYFAFSVVGFNGSGVISYKQALGAVFMEGWLFLILSLLGVRQWLARVIPKDLALATGAGIGLFIALIGLTPSGGLGVVGGDYSNLLGLGGCLPEHRDPDHPNFCTTQVLRNPTIWLGMFVGGFFTVLLMVYRVRGAIIFGILLVSIISWPRTTPVTFFPYNPIGDANFDFFKQVVALRPVKYVLNALDYDYNNPQLWVALVTFLYVDLMDTTGTLYSMARFANVMNDRTQDFENSTIAYCVDAFCISIGSLLGTSPVTAFIESATGISEGGKTGLTAMTTGICFFISIFFAPIFASIPAWATGGALIISGSLMIRNAADINWGYLGDAVPAFLTLIIIPFTYSIAYGLIAGLAATLILKTFPWALAKLTNGRIVPHEYEKAHPWRVPPGGLAPLWMRKVARGDRRFWTDEEIEGEGEGEGGGDPEGGVGGAASGLPKHRKSSGDSSGEEKEKEVVVPPKESENVAV